MILAMNKASKWTESTPASVARLYYELLALEAQKKVLEKWKK